MLYGDLIIGALRDSGKFSGRGAAASDLVRGPGLAPLPEWLERIYPYRYVFPRMTTGCDI